jgi:hypothetical protein
MTVLSNRPHQRYSHAALRTHARDPEPRVEELLDDPITQALMARDRVRRPELEELIARVRRRLGPDDGALYSGLEAKLLVECP